MAGDTECENRRYIAIDLKSFYASVECVERELDPLTTHLVVADETRTNKTICLAVSPALKAYGVPGRPRLFEVEQKVEQVNNELARRARGRKLTGYSWDDTEVRRDPSLGVSYITAVPRMGLYMEYSTRIYDIYLRYVAPEDIHIYSVDEVFIDATPYLRTRGQTAREFAMTMIKAVLRETGITATAGIGTNMYLCKIAMDIVAKRIPADADGVRIAELDELTYRRLLWNHRPLTDFWRVGPGYARKLEANGIYTMGDVARCSLGGPEDFHNEDLLYKLFGVNAELLIDHAWGWEPCTIADVHAYKPSSHSLSQGQVLNQPYTFEKARIVIREMADLLILDLVDKGLAADQVVLTVGYDRESLTRPEIRKKYKGKIKKDHYGRAVPVHAHGTISLGGHTSSYSRIMKAAMELFNRIVNRDLLVRRMYIVAGGVVPEASVSGEGDKEKYRQMSIFDAAESGESGRGEEGRENGREYDGTDHLEKERNMQKAILTVKERYGKNAMFRAMDLEEGATALERNRQIGGHKA